MKNSEIFKKFKDAVEKVKQGELFKFDEWLRESGVEPRKLNQEEIFRYFWRNPDKVFGNNELILKIGKYIGHFLKDMDKRYHIPIIGVNGSGKTLVLRIIEDLTRSFETNLGSSINIVDNEDFLRRVVKTEPDIVTSSSAKRGAIKFIDDCDKVEEISKILENIVKLRDYGVYITAWTPESWLVFNKTNKEILPSTEQFILTPFENDSNFTNFFNNICNSIMILEGKADGEVGAPGVIPGFTFNIHDFLPDKLYQYTYGIPKLTIKLFLACIQQTFLAGKEKINVEIIDSVAKRMGLCGVKEKIENLSAQHILILFELLVEKNREGTRPKALVDEFDLDKSTIAYHLKELKKKELIEVEKIGKSSFYKVKENLIPFIQQKIMRKMIEIGEITNINHEREVKMKNG